VTLGPNLGVSPLEQTRHVGVAKTEHPRLTNGELFSKNSNLCDHNSPTSQTDGRTDRQTTCDRNTALCTKVHRAVKTNRTIPEIVVMVVRNSIIAKQLDLRTAGITRPQK